MPPVIDFFPEKFKEYCATKELILLSPLEAKCHKSYISSLTDLVCAYYDDGSYPMQLFVRNEFKAFASSEDPEFVQFGKLITVNSGLADDAVLAHNHAQSLMMAGNFLEASEIYKIILAAAPLYGDAAYGYALCCEATGDAKNYIANLLKAIGINPYHEEAAIKAFWFYNMGGLFTEAKGILEKYITINPDNAKINKLLQEMLPSRKTEPSLKIDPMRDESLDGVFEFIETGSVTLLSVDCFDTLVSRLSPEPINVFIEIGRRLIARNLLKNGISPLAFQKLRQEAENLARKAALQSRHNDECTIAEIYQQLEHIVRIPSEGVNIEIDVESELCYLNPSVAELINIFAKKHGRVAIVSDTYLSASHLATILTRNGFDLGLVDCIWTSSDQGCSKHNSKLFHVIMRHYESTPQQILHIGDNKRADIEMPKNIGINTLYYYRMDDFSAATIQKERIVNHIRSYSASVDSVRVQASRLCSHLPEEDRGYYKIGAFLFGPLLARYADWVVGECRKEGITTVLALMREAVVLGPMVERAAKAAGYALKVKTFYASRASMKLASLCKATHKSLLSRIDKFGGKITFDEVLKMMGLSSEMIGFSDEVKNSVVPDMDALVHELTQGGIAELIEKNSAELRVAAMHYLQKNLAGADKVVIVDLGYRGTIQRYMEDMLAFEGVQCQLIGCYFTTTQHASSQILAGSDIRAYMGDVGSEEFLIDCFRRHPEILEQSICATTGSTEGYAIMPNGEVEPRLGLSFSPEEENRKKELIQEGIFSFQSRWLDIMLTKGFLTNPDSKVMLEEIDDYSRSILHRISAFPSQYEASLLGTLHHDDNNGADTGNLICNDEARKSFREHGYQGLINARPYWHDGVVALERSEWIDNFFQTWLYHACM
jgi:predicted HAD superfamily hydrolase